MNDLDLPFDKIQTQLELKRPLLNAETLAEKLEDLIRAFEELADKAAQIENENAELSKEILRYKTAITEAVRDLERAL